MNKSNLRKIAYELNLELKGDVKSFIFLVASKYLNVHNLQNNWLKNFLNIDNVESNLEIIDKYSEEFEDIECICWLYQYFISDEKSRVFNNLKNNIKVEKEDIHYATRTFYTRLDC